MASDWTDCRLADIADLTGGYAFKSSQYIEDGVFVLRTLNIEEGGSINPEDAVFVSDSDADEFKRFELFEGDILFVMVGATLGKVGRVSEEVLPALLNQNMWKIRAKDSLADQNFLYYCFKKNVSEITGWASGSARGFLRRDDCRNLSISLPSLQEQRAIAHILGTLDEKIELNKKSNDTLEGISKALFKSWFLDFDPVRAKAEGRPTGLPDQVSKLFPDSFQESELGEIPSGWSLMPLDKIANYLNGLALQKFPPKGDHTDLPVIKIAQLRKGDAVDSDKCSNELSIEYLIKDGDILFSWSGSLLVDVWVGGTGALNQHLFKVTSQDFEKWFYYWWTKHYLEEFQAIAQSKATTMGHIQRRHLSEALVVVPPEEVLEWMNKTFLPMLNRQIQGRLESRTLMSLRDALLPCLISGELRVPDAEKMLQEVGV